MRAERQPPLRIDWMSRRKYAIRPSNDDIDFHPLVLGIGCCLWASPGIMPSLLFVGCAAGVAVAIAVLEPIFDERRLSSIRGQLFDGPSLAFETFVTLVALSMRLSPIERDFVAASFFTLLCRYSAPARDVGQQSSAGLPVLRDRSILPSVYRG